MKIVTIAGLGWLPIAALVAWWMGFAPFPTRPDAIYSHQEVFEGIGSVHKGPSYLGLISEAEAKKRLDEVKYGLNSWSCEEPPNANHCTMVERREEPFFGWGSPHWLLRGLSYTPGSVGIGEFPSRLYRSYAACAWMAERMSDKATAQEMEYERWAVEHGQKPEVAVTSYSCVELPK